MSFQMYGYSWGSLHIYLYSAAFKSPWVKQRKYNVPLKEFVQTCLFSGWCLWLIIPECTCCFHFKIHKFKSHEKFTLLNLVYSSKSASLGKKTYERKFHWHYSIITKLYSLNGNTVPKVQYEMNFKRMEDICACEKGISCFFYALWIQRCSNFTGPCEICIRFSSVTSGTLIMQCLSLVCQLGMIAQTFACIVLLGFCKWL